MKRYKAILGLAVLAVAVTLIVSRLDVRAAAFQSSPVVWVWHGDTEPGHGWLGTIAEIMQSVRTRITWRLGP